MRICQDHWDKLKAAIKDRGLDHLVAKSGEEAAAMIAMITARLSGDKSQYDPLVDCHWMISRKGLEEGGLYLMGQKEDGSPYCPICVALAHLPDDVTLEEAVAYWIDGPANAALEHCRKLGLVPGVQ